MSTRGADPRLVPLAAAGVALLVRMFVLSATGEPIGTDGYYYVVQIEDLVATGALHVPDASWTLRALALPHALGLEPIGALAVGGAVLATLPSVVATALGGKARWALLLALLLAASPTLTHLAADFPKSLGLAAPWLAAALALDRAREDHRWMGLAVPALLLAATAHRLGAVFAVLTLLGAGLGAAVASSRDPRRLATWIGAALAGAGLLGGGLLAAATVLPGLLHPDDLARIGAVGTSLRPPPWSWWSTRSDTSWVQLVELLLPWLALLAAPWAARARPVLAGACALPLLACLAPIYPPDVLDLGYRVSLFAPLFAAPLLALAVVPRLRPPSRPDVDPLLAVAPLVVLAGFGPAASTTPPYGLYETVLEGIPEPYPELLIAHLGMNFLYDHRTGHEAMAWAPDPGFPIERVGRVAYGITPGEWLLVWKEGDPEIVPLGQGYHYVGEATWRRLQQLADDDPDLTDRIHDWRNPTQVRPSYLTGRR